MVVLDEGIAEIPPGVDGAGKQRLEPIESLAAHHPRGVGRHDVVVTVCSSDDDGIGAQPRLGVQLTIEHVDADRLEGSGPLDGLESVGECGEAVEIIARLEYDDVGCRSSWRVVAPLTNVLIVGIGCAILLVILTTPLSLGGVTFAVSVIDAEMIG